MNKKRIGAIAALVVIVCLYGATVVLAFLDSPFARSCLMASLFCTIVVPVILYVYLMILHFFSDKKQGPKESSPDKKHHHHDT